MMRGTQNLKQAELHSEIKITSDTKPSFPVQTQYHKSQE